MKVIVKIVVAAALMCGTTVSMAQDTKIRFFGQPEVGFSNRTDKNRITSFVDPANGFKATVADSTFDSKTNFNTGNYVLFVTSQISERISVLSEVSFKNTGNTFNFELQRLALKYYIQDYFSVRVGKMFTPIGYWNNQFTLGLVLQPTIQRPYAIRPVSEGGQTQFRDTGIQFEGENITNARFFYKVLVANGVGYHGSNDKWDNHVAVTTQIGAEPIEGLKVIASGMFDRIEQGKSNPNGYVASLPDNGRVQLLTVAAAYMNAEKKPEFIAEFTRQNSKFDNIQDASSYSYYVYGGYKVTDKITPYVLYNYSQAGKSETEADLYFSPVPVKINTLTIGARYKFNANFIAKVEYEHHVENQYYSGAFLDGIAQANGVPFAPGNNDIENSSKRGGVRLQFAFAF